jgi:hypothetical protein
VVVGHSSGFVERPDFGNDRIRNRIQAS